MIIVFLFYPDNVLTYRGGPGAILGVGVYKY
jgi:hypothetical protein